MAGYSLKPDVDDDVPTKFPFSTFVECLRLPKLSTLAVKLTLINHEDAREQDFTNIIDNFIPRLGAAAHLENLSLIVHDSWRVFKKCLRMMSVALDKYLSLRMLTLGNSGRLFVSPSSTLHPNLKNRGLLERINLLKCEEGAEDFLAWAVGELDGDGDGFQNLKKVVVKECGSTNEREFPKYVPSDKLEFEPEEVDYLTMDLL